MSDSLIYQSIIPSELSYSQCNITPVMINDSNIISLYIYIYYYYISLIFCKVYLDLIQIHSN